MYVAGAVDAVIDFCAREQLGMPYAAHATSLTVGKRVTWYVELRQDRLAIIEAKDGDIGMRIYDLELVKPGSP